MPEVERRTSSRGRMVDTERRQRGGVGRTVDRPRPQYEGLFREPDLPPYVEDDEG